MHWQGAAPGPLQVLLLLLHLLLRRGVGGSTEMMLL